MTTAQFADYGRCSLNVSDLKIVNNQRVKKFRFQGESYWGQQPEDCLLILLSGELTVHYVDRQHRLTPGELFPLHRLHYYRLISGSGAELVSLEKQEAV